jgi:hypothetical protein
MKSSFRNYALCRIGFTFAFWLLHKFVLNDEFLAFLFHSLDSIGLSNERSEQTSFQLLHNLNPYSSVENGYLQPTPLSVLLSCFLSHSLPFLSLLASLRAEWLVVSRRKSTSLPNTL